MADLFEDPEMQDWLRRMAADSGTKIIASRFGMAVWDGTFDPIMAFQVGCFVLLDKPLIAIVTPGVHLPVKLVDIADELVEFSDNPDTLQERVGKAIGRIRKQLGDE
jgi:hypothetical protein